MIKARLSRWRRVLETVFPERHLYLRSGGDVRGLSLSTNRQLLLGAAVACAALWTGVGTASLLMAMLSASPAQQAIHERAYYERLMADTRARLNSAVAQLNDSDGSVGQLAQATEKRHEALVMLLTELNGDPGLATTLKPAPVSTFANQTPVQAIRSVRDDQERLIAQASSYAKSRADRLRLALKLAGLDPTLYGHVGAEGLGGPLIDAKDPRALAAVLDVDPDFAERIQHAATDLSDSQAMTATTKDLPLSRPTQNTAQTSGFGVRADPFTGRPAFHAGQDFAGPIGTPIHSTAPGIISFTGVRTGYGNTIEIDHGHGFKTRYAHLSQIGVTVGEHVALGERIGAMGSTGRSTGPHLHYEVWVDGRPQNPKRFLEAGDYVQQAG